MATLGIQFALAAFSMGFLPAIIAVVSYLCFSGLPRDVMSADDGSATD